MPPQQADDPEAAGEHDTRGKSATLAHRSCCGCSARARDRRGWRRRHLWKRTRGRSARWAESGGLRQLGCTV